MAEPATALLGCGHWGQNHLRVWSDLGCLEAVVDSDPARLSVVKERYPDLKTYSDPQRVLESKDIQAVIIATPAPSHAALALAALESGKDVLVEKPLATSVGDAEKMCAAAEAQGAVLMVGHVLEYHPAVRKLRALAAEGELGKILYIYSHRLNFGKVRTEENVLWSFAPHDIAIFLRLLGDPVEVACRGGSHLSQGVADVTLMDMTFANNAGGHIFVSWLHPFKEHRLVVIGEKQMAVFNDTAPHAEKLLLYPHRVEWSGGRVPVAQRADAVRVAVEEEEPLLAECRHFLECIAERRRPLTDGASGLAVLRLLEAGEQSLLAQGAPLKPGAAASDGVFIHPTATVDAGAEIGQGTRIWHYSHVMAGARIGSDCVLGQNVFIAGGVCIGAGVKIQNNVSVFEGVELEDDVFCGPSAVFTNVVNPRSEVSRKDAFEATLVRRGATLGANCTVVCGNEIGRYAFVAAGAVVTEDVPDHAVVMGVPARFKGWVCFCGERLGLTGDDGVCASCEREFKVHDGKLLLTQTL